MVRRVGVFGTSEETLKLLQLLAANPQLEIAAIWDADPEGARRLAQNVAPEIVSLLDSLLADLGMAA